MEAKLLREKIIQSISNQGFSVNGKIVPLMDDKAFYKQIHLNSRKEQINIHKSFLLQNIKLVKPYLKNGKDIDPQKIDLVIQEVEPESLNEIIFKWWNFIWWSVPYQRAYGRQMRFIIWDRYHEAPVGLIGLQSPILKMSVRDEYLRIPRENLDYWINKSMQAQRLGALPPYNDLIAGKMVALSITSNELRSAYKRKYQDTVTLLKGRSIEPELLFITTTSAFGRSSIYNRLKYKNEEVAVSLGFTRGSGTFHIPEELYKEILGFLKSKGENTSTSFGNGPSRKIKLLDRAFSHLGIADYTYHNLFREFFLFPLVKNLPFVLHQNKNPFYLNRPLIELEAYWKERWCIPRSERLKTWQDFNSAAFVNKIENEIINGR